MTALREMDKHTWDIHRVVNETVKMKQSGRNRRKTILSKQTQTQ